MPPELLRHPKVAARAKKRRRAPGDLLLDQALDHDAMRALPDADRRGRPDIAHLFLLLALDSPLTKRGLTRVLIHTRHDELIRVRPDTRIMRHQPKFVALLEDLLRQGEVPRGDPLLTAERDRPLEGVVRELPGTRVLLDAAGAPARSPRFADLARAGDVSVALGGFPRGAFRQAQPSWFDHVLRVADEEITAAAALVPALAGFEDALLGG